LTMAKATPAGPALLQKTSARRAKPRTCSFRPNECPALLLKSETTYIPTGFGSGQVSRVQTYTRSPHGGPL